MIVESAVTATRKRAGISFRRWWDLATVGCIAAVCLTRALFRGLPVVKHGVDVMVALDAAWRVLNGQRPHVDFYSALGPLSSWTIAFGLALAHHAADGINYGDAILGFLVGSWSFLIARARLSAPAAAFFATLCSLLMVAPAALGEPFFIVNEAMFYNRYGYALMAVILIEAYLPPREDSSAFTGGLSTGIACCALLFLKASYFLVTVPLVILMLAARRQTSARVAGICLGFGSALVAMLAYLGFHVGAIVHDLRMAAAARVEGANPAKYREVLTFTFASNLGLMLLATLVGFTNADPERRRWAISARYRPILAAALVVGAGIVIVYSNYQWSVMPLNAVLAIALSDAAIRHFGDRRLWLRAVLTVWALCLALPLMTTNAHALVYGLRKSRTPVSSPGVSLIHSGVMNNVKVMGPSNVWFSGFRYVDEVNEGIDLLRRSSPANETVYSLAYVNPFSYALERRPAWGGSTWLDPMYNFSDTHKPDPESLFGHADVVMVPKAPGLPVQEYILRNYLGYLTARFHLAAESGNWRLYRRNPQ